MCGFFFINDSKFIKNSKFEDVHSRGLYSKEFHFNTVYALQSLLPCVSGIEDFSVYETSDHLFLFSGEIYNYDRTYKTDTLYFLENLLKDDSFLKDINGMYAFLLFNKKTKRIRVGRDCHGQIPLFCYNKNGILIFSNTVKSIVLNSPTYLESKSLSRWKSTRHYIFDNTPWNGIKLFPPGHVAEYDIEGNIISFKSMEVTRIDKYVSVIHDFDKNDYISQLPMASIVSGGVDSSIITKLFDKEISHAVTINHEGKDVISNRISEFQPYLKTKIESLNIDKESWMHYTREFVNEVYLFPYSWSWIGYYIIGKHLKGKVNVLLTGEGADEIFGGYANYAMNTFTEYGVIKSGNNFSKKTKTEIKKLFKLNKLITNKLLDQKMFIPTSSIGANLALGCSTIESRNPFLDNKFSKNDYFLHFEKKENLINIFESFYGKHLLYPKQGFGGFPNELYSSVFNEQPPPDLKNNDPWKVAAFHLLKPINHNI